MKGSLKKLEQAVYDNRLKAIFQEIESADSSRQHLLLLQAAEIALFLDEQQESLSYILQANLIQDSYETHVVLACFYILRGTYNEAHTHLLYAREKKSRQFEVFSWEKLDSQLAGCDIPEGILEALENLKYPSDILSGGMISFQEILDEDPAHAPEIFRRWKEQSGLSLKYPELDKLSIEVWEKEFPDRKEQIEEKESLRQQSSLELEELMQLGKMYFLENEFSKAAECFTSAKNLYILAHSV